MGRTAHHLTDQQRAFAACYVTGETAGVGGASAAAAGYAPNSARQEAYRLLRHDGVRAEIDRLTREAIGDHAVAAVNLLGRVIQDEKAPIKARVDAAKTILDRAGYIAPKAAEPEDNRPRPVAEMSLAELQAVYDRLQKDIAETERELVA
jgi:phage terminase small subunit